MSHADFKVQFLPVASQTLDATLAACQTMFSITEELNSLYFSVARDTLRNVIQDTRSLLAVQNLQDFASIKYLTPQISLDKIAVAPRDAFEISVKAVGELAGLLNSQAAQFNQAASEVVQKATVFQQSLQAKNRR